MEDMLLGLLEALNIAIVPLLSAALLFIAKKAGDFMNSNIKRADNELLESVALRMVMWSNDFMKDQPGKDRLENAVDRLLRNINRNGKKIIDEDDAYHLIRQAYERFRITTTEDLTSSKK